jgi:predicted metal-dependent enzyme (double-stranded beta helix superfamily)
MSMFDLDRFVADLRTALSEPSRQSMKEIVARAISEPASLFRVIGEPDQPVTKVLYRSEDLTILNVAWSPEQITLPHNHLMTAVIGMYGGREDNIFWRRVPNQSKYQIEAAGGQALGAGDVALLGRDVIHSVINPLRRKVSGALHVYDGDFFGVSRSMWDAETLAEEPYDRNKVVKRKRIEGAP